MADCVVASGADGDVTPALAAQLSGCSISTGAFVRMPLQRRCCLSAAGAP